MGVDYRELEQEICRIPEVSAARIVENEEGAPVEVHILAAPTKLAKQVVRDVQSVAMAAFGVELDRRTISVVQLEGSTLRLAPSPEGAEDEPAETEEPEPAAGPAPAGEPVMPRRRGAAAAPSPPAAAAAAAAPPDPPSARTRLVSVQTQRQGRRARAEVTLAAPGGEATGSAEGLFTESAALRLVCLAALSALRQLDPQADRTDLESAAIVTLGMRQVALVGIVLVEGAVEELCTGSALVRVTGPFDALARATLDAINRRLSRPR